jgi:uncharacterized protein (TIGR02996 family)
MQPKNAKAATGRMKDRERRAFERAIADKPNDAAAHQVYADWLEDSGLEQEASQQRWMAKVLRGEIQHELIFTRQGLVRQASWDWDYLPPSARTYWRRAVPQCFSDHPDVWFIVASHRTPRECGFRRQNGSRFADQGDSPVLYWRRNHGSKCRILIREPETARHEDSQGRR